MIEGLKEVVRDSLQLGWKSITLIVIFFILAAIFVVWTQRPEEELLLKKLKALGLPVVGVGPNVNVSEALETGTQTVSSCNPRMTFVLVLIMRSTQTRHMLFQPIVFLSSFSPIQSLIA